ncbi:telomeric repeat binding factor a isoform X2 [Plectropomus leopardus]|uniref:telomeric repeat binding factor a isoform X2 n=1 Tax=Plectropomus leopardus TaxID=160734 RepID=UPI001C4DAA26|nr:telomeric repeat binding factor a isoform X2 [Plectropomus leopardus]
MAATEVQATVNRWIVEYYFSLAIELFRNQQYSEFCAIRDVLDSILVRPVEPTDVMPTKIQILQFLSRINDGENLDMLFEADQSITPLESALMMLENMSQQCSVPEQDLEKACASLKEMMVCIIIKNSQFDRAEEVLKKHFPKPMVGKEAIFMALIRKKSKMHEVIRQIDFQQFKEEMLTFCQSLCPFNDPFLHKAAKQLIEERLLQKEDKAASPDEQDEPGPSSRPITSVQSQFVPWHIIQKNRLEAAYEALAAASNKRTFAQLEEEVEGEEQAREDLSLRLSPTPKKGTNQDSEQDGLFQRDSGSPLEASPADHPAQTDALPQTQAGSLSKCSAVVRTRRPFSVARLVVEPDSQGSSQCSAASQECETDVRTEEPPEPPAVPSQKDPQSLETDNEVTTPKQIASTSSADLSGPEEDPPETVANRDISEEQSSNQLNSPLSRNSTKSQQSSSDNEEDQQESVAPSKTSRDPDAVRKTDSSLDSSPTLYPLRSPVPQTSSTPHKVSAQDKSPSNSKWKQLFNAAKETKDTWSDEESFFTSKKNTSGSPNKSSILNPSHRKRKWTESETKKLKQGVKKFGEGNWGKIKTYYDFQDRTNVNLKDRWRTMKRLNLV